jgi:hypothetical protein
MRRSLAGLLLAFVVTACSGTAPAPTQPPSDGAETLHGQVLDGAREVAGLMEDRQAEMESMLP